MSVPWITPTCQWGQTLTAEILRDFFCHHELWSQSELGFVSSTTTQSASLGFLDVFSISLHLSFLDYKIGVMIPCTADPMEADL